MVINQFQSYKYSTLIRFNHILQILSSLICIIIVSASENVGLRFDRSLYFVG